MTAWSHRLPSRALEGRGPSAFEYVGRRPELVADGEGCGASSQFVFDGRVGLKEVGVVLDPLPSSINLGEELLALVFEILDLGSCSVGPQPPRRLLALGDGAFDPRQVFDVESLTERTVADSRLEVSEPLVELLVAPDQGKQSAAPTGFEPAFPA